MSRQYIAEISLNMTLNHNKNKPKVYLFVVLNDIRPILVFLLLYQEFIHKYEKWQFYIKKSSSLLDLCQNIEILIFKNHILDIKIWIDNIMSRNFTVFSVQTPKLLWPHVVRHPSSGVRPSLTFYIFDFFKPLNEIWLI